VRAVARTRFRRSVAISHGALFRDPEQFQLLEQVLLSDGRRLTVWSAGCADGLELCTLGIVLERLGALERLLLLGTSARVDTQPAHSDGRRGRPDRARRGRRDDRAAGRHRPPARLGGGGAPLPGGDRGRESHGDGALAVQTTVRGYLVSAGQSFVAPYARVRAELPDAARELQRLVAGNELQPRRAQAIRDDAIAYVDTYAYPIIATTRDRGVGAGRSFAA
jgi:hypothetical protein